MRYRNLLLSHHLRIIAIVVGNYRTHPEQTLFTTDAVLIGTRDVACYRVSSSFCFPPLPARYGDTRITRQGADLLTC
jgi:hypothetical protein